MLDKDDFQMLQQLFSASEARMTAKIQESEERMAGKIQLSPLERMEKLEGDVDLLKIIIRQMREELDQLKGA